NFTSTDHTNGMYTISLEKGKKYHVVINMKGYLYFSSVLDLSDPNVFRKKEPFADKIRFKQEELDRIQKELDEQNSQLKQALQSGSDDIQAMFDKVEATMKKYKAALAELENVMAEAKYRWLEEEGQSLNLRQDYTLQSVTVGAKFELKNIFFDFGKTTLKKESETELDKLFEILSKSEIVIELGGHTDSIGSEEANQKLSQERVNSVKSYLVNKGIDGQRILAVGYGETQPIASNSSDEGRALNRRVEVKIIKLQMDREGGEEVVEEKKDEKKKKKEEPAVVEAPKGDMLALLQKAAKNGGLPSGSDCNKEVSYNPNYNSKDTKKKNNNWNNNSNFNGGFNWKYGEIGKKEFILKSFNASLVNWQYQPLNGGSIGAEVSFVSNKLRENALQYYFINRDDSVKMGFGYTHMRNRQIGKSPILLVYGADLKAFNGRVGNMTEEGFFGHLGIPIGIRYMMSPKGLIIAPEIFYNLGIRVNSDNDVFQESLSYLRIGANTRWKLLHGGLYLNMGETISFMGFRAGVSF
ncbi:MAG: OmpA family protein, partial [Bacteroidota bacterium]|nr:OmpA family protein [Bacteroidota bacterium]MDX5429932.1 OmpA family protein [Bacteroidota bacterium]MDX5468705.1 OmpA family protein [Bacteroidota bacterium]